MESAKRNHSNDPNSKQPIDEQGRYAESNGATQEEEAKQASRLFGFNDNGAFANNKQNRAGTLFKKEPSFLEYLEMEKDKQAKQNKLDRESARQEEQKRIIPFFSQQGKPKKELPPQNNSPLINPNQTNYKKEAADKEIGRIINAVENGHAGYPEVEKFILDFSRKTGIGLDYAKEQIEKRSPKVNRLIQKWHSLNTYK